MRKSDLFELIAAIRLIAPGETPIIVGSQAAHLVSDFPPDIVRQSIECDFLLIGEKTEARVEINKKLGVFSSFQVEHGFYADALGLATVVLPHGWRERLHSLKDENGNIIAYAAEIHDIAVSKLIAGREKDFLFLRELLIRGIIKIDTFLQRARLIGSMPQSAVLISRLEALEKHLRKNETSKVCLLIKQLKA